jgi:hypothetical protein
MKKNDMKVSVILGMVTHQWVFGTSVSKLYIPRRIDHHAVLQCQAPITQ